MRTGRRRWVSWSLGVLVLVPACFADPPMVEPGSTGLTTTESDTRTVGTSVAGTSTGTAEASTGSESTEGADSTTSTSTESTSTGPGFVCGNGVIEGDERCEGPNLGGEDCLSLGYDAGRLACSDDCVFDPSGCVRFGCGDDQVQGVEVCDGSDLAGQDCSTQGFDAGELACAADCQSFDASGCVVFTCGDNVIEGMEACDGNNLGGEDCVSLGLVGGTLACLPGCADFDISGCISCGNDMVDGSDVCDNIDFAGESCVSQGLGAGTLACAPDCGSLDTTGCGTVSDCCYDNGTADCDDAACSNVICLADPYCCDMEWDGVCATSAEFECGVCQGLTCPHLACETGIPLMPACDTCVDLVCTAEPSCCTTAWDATCVAAVAMACTTTACP